MEQISIFPRTGVRGLQRLSLWGRMLRKIPVISKNASNKNYSELNFIQKTQWTHISFGPRSGSTDTKHLPFLKQITMYWNGKIGSLWGWTLSKVLIVLKNDANWREEGRLGISNPPPWACYGAQLWPMVVSWQIAASATLAQGY